MWYKCIHLLDIVNVDCIEKLRNVRNNYVFLDKLVTSILKDH